ncbi:MAG: IS982 family transposase [Pseudanabaenaceae cyanobacterium bins.68]|nr:IS982 family transposase [Pseudanabaenaceae cyanobacterium bins.68]
MALCCYFHFCCRGRNTGISFIDSTSIKACRNQRANSHKVFAGLADWGKNSFGWYYGFKLHLVINEQGELLSFVLTPANTDDRTVVPKLLEAIVGKVFGDKGYISQKLFNQLLNKGVQLITTVRKNMKNKLMTLEDKLWLKKRRLIETVNDQLKNMYLIEHSRHRKVANFMVNLVAGLIAYTYQPEKPSAYIDYDSHNAYIYFIELRFDQLRLLIRERLEVMTQDVIASIVGWDYILEALSVAGI